MRFIDYNAFTGGVFLDQRTDTVMEGALDAPVILAAGGCFSFDGIGGMQMLVVRGQRGFHTESGQTLAEWTS